MRSWTDVDADVVIGFGGYVALPAYLAARGGPTAPPRAGGGSRGQRQRGAGQSGRGPARRARALGGAGPGLRHAEVVGVPVRAAITSLDRLAIAVEARAHFGFADDARVLLVFGGSQGAASINRAVAAAAGELAAAGVSVLHAHGPRTPSTCASRGAVTRRTSRSRI